MAKPAGKERGDPPRLPEGRIAAFSMGFIPISCLPRPGTADRPPSDGSGPGPELRGKTFGRLPFPSILPLYLPGETGAFFARKRAKPRKKIFQALPRFPSFPISRASPARAKKRPSGGWTGGAFLSICGRRRRLFLKSGHRCRQWGRSRRSPAGARRDRPSGRGA